MDNLYAYYPKSEIPPINGETPGFFKYTLYSTESKDKKHPIVDIKHSSEIKDNGYTKGISKIHDGLLYKIGEKWPWYRIGE